MNVMIIKINEGLILVLVYFIVRLSIRLTRRIHFLLEKCDKSTLY